MALAMSNLLQCPNLRLSQRNFRPKVSETSLSFVRFSKIDVWSGRRLICAAASAAGSSNSGSDLNPYEVLGVSPIEGFDMIKAAYTKKRKEAERIGDEETAARLEKAYDRVMMAQLTNRKKGVAFGSFKVSKDIKYADKQPIVPWGPRFSKSSKNDMHINLAISAVFVSVQMKNCFGERQCSETEDGEDTGEGLRMGKRLLRSLALVFGCIAVSSLAYTGLLNFIEFSGGYIPALLYNSQELIITTSSAVMLYIMASFYR
ncbi:protein CHLOROPLAST J-LIKE DOMAIN 1, chloroplastic isoform X2 [Prosopis cineraria]|uniref:protein CHLOROPLAST J-LIKE DOMAIN 1, chloroplastic isoform X2 n=1 Tax=Prosopis cineraria TaxID=364024 RepID=UPI0024109310|nr:protein CHLOROPLAST J-LIKE DOMAIN 1, chloroplastic isoform X2 [Prosopis cineraria]